MTSSPLLAVSAGAAPLDLGSGGHLDPVAPLVLALAAILVAAKLAGDLAVRLRQPAVLGELLVGVLLGNLGLAGINMLDGIKIDPFVDMLARMGVLILLFEVGLESTVKQMLSVGLSAFLVAVLGVATPFALGWAASAWLLPASSSYVHAFIGATLCATSVGITARVLKDLGRSSGPEARVILGAAVIDDVLGLVILGVITGIIVASDQGQTMSYGSVAAIIGKSAAFLVGSLALGVWLSPRVFQVAARLRADGTLLAVGLAFCFVLSWFANQIGLASIVGAFAAGLILEDVHFRVFRQRGEHTLEELVHPIASFLTPIFFVLMGMHTDLTAFGRPDVLALALALTIVAIAGKQAAGFGVLGGVADRLSVGIGMVPRGEVGLIFANIGLGLTLGGSRLIDDGVFSAVVAMVILTTLVTPPALTWSFRRLPREPRATQAAARQDAR